MDGKAPLATGEDDDDEVPDLVENFDEVSKNEANWSESASEKDKTWKKLLGAAILWLLFKIVFVYGSDKI